MINISITANKVIIKGHSGYADSGTDIVCSGISTLFYAFYGYLAKRGVLKAWQANPGDSFITFAKEGKEGLLMFTEGVKMVAESFPDYVKVNIK
jgi:uncharacterized protein YsxB (DUF464 family)